jgi:hypothetical protein
VHRCTSLGVDEESPPHGFVFIMERNKEAHMAVIVLAENKALTREMYEMMLEKLRPVMKDAPGFVAHMGWSTPDGWRVCEIWRSQADANQFFAKFVHPNLPPDAKPHRTVFELHALVEK